MYGTFLIGKWRNSTDVSWFKCYCVRGGCSGLLWRCCYRLRKRTPYASTQSVISVCLTIIFYSDKHAQRVVIGLKETSIHLVRIEVFLVIHNLLILAMTVAIFSIYMKLPSWARVYHQYDMLVWLTGITSSSK